MRVLKGILLGSILVSAGPALADDAAELQALKARLKQLEQRMDTQARKQEAQAAKVNSVVATKAPSPFDPCPGGKLCYKGITLTFGGWLDLTDIYRTRNLSSDVGSIYNSIPFRGNRNYNIGENRFSARTSRLSLLAEGNVSPEFSVKGYGEIDFESAGSTSNPVATNSFTPRMRQASIEIDRNDLGWHVLAGQTWSLTSPSKVGIDPRGIDGPPVVDFESVPGIFAARQPGVRIWMDFGPEFSLAVSAENAQTIFVGGNGDFRGATPFVGTGVSGIPGVVTGTTLFGVTGPGGSFFNPLTNLSLNRVPDVTVKGAWDPVVGGHKLHVEAWGLYRELLDRSLTVNHPVSAFAVGGHVAYEVLPKVLEFQFTAAQGALGRFSATPFSDATFREDGTFQVLPILGIQGGLMWHAVPGLDIYGFAGLEKTKATFSFGSTGLPFGYGNPLYDNRGCNVENSPAVQCNGNTKEIRQLTGGFYKTLYQGAFGAVKLGTQYSYTQRFTFEGVGGAPKTDEHIVMTQLRYYPF
ncbi:hypothetical protein ACFFWD_38650 [Bradyrhizobium erythrophlei]|uniref:hypothetical protein n=1 Tax=Bradyrhizobium erythrophlei TaxID=1437360 RepID=UPI0035E94676